MIMFKRTNIALALFLLSIVAGSARSDPKEDLWAAARKGDVAALEKLLDQKVDPNIATSYGGTALWFAAMHGKTDAVKLLLKRGARTDVRDNVWNESPLTAALGNQTLDTVEVLLRAGAAGADELAIRAATSANAKLLKLVLDSAKIEPDTLSAALLLAPAKSPEIIETLKKAGAKPFPLVGAGAAKWKECEGDYEDARGVRAEFHLQEGYLVGRIINRDDFVLKPMGDGRFQAFGRPSERFHFERKDGKVSGFLHRSGTIESPYGRGQRPEATVLAKGGQEEPSGRPSLPCNWPSFRGDNACGVAEGQNLPASWDTTKGRNILWKTPIPGLGHSAPVIWEDRVFLTTAVGSEEKAELRTGTYGDGDAAKDTGAHQYRVYCLDKNTGKILWQKTAHQGVPQVKRHIKSSHANPTPATDGKHLVVSFASEGLYCYDLDGKLLWKRNLGVVDAGAFNAPEMQWGAASSPIIYRNLAIIQCDRHKDSYMAAFNLDDGSPVWKTARDEIPSWGTPTLVEGPTRPELVANGTNRICGYDPLTGKELWRLSPNSQITTPTPISADGLIFVTSGYRPIQPIYAIRPGASGDISLKADEESNTYLAWSKKRGGPYTPTPIVVDHRLYTCTNYGILTCLDVRSGNEIYRQRLGGGGGYSASPVAADGKIFCASEAGEVRVVKAGPKFELLAVNTMGEPCLSTPAISEGKLFIRTQSHLYAIGWPKPAKKPDVEKTHEK